MADRLADPKGVFMTMWTIFDHPTDFPDHYVARENILRNDNTYGPSENFIQSTDLEVVREQLLHMGKTPIPRDPSDQANIIETWI